MPIGSESISRRHILATGATIGLGGRLPAIGNPFSNDNLILGTGKHRFRCIHDWLKAPQGLLFGETHGLAQDTEGRIYVAHTVGHGSLKVDAIAVYAEDGEFLTSWGSRFRGGAHGLDLRTEGSGEYLYHCDIAHRKVVKTRLNGEVVWELGAPLSSGKYSSGETFIPTNVAFLPDGGFLVADGYGSNWIHRYDAAGNYKATFGGSGTDPGKVIQPHGLWVDTRGSDPLLAVADRGNRRIQFMDFDGRHVRFATEGIRLPCHFDIRDGVMVVPDLESMVTLLDERDHVIVHIGDGHPSGLRGRPKEEFLPGKFIHPHDAMFLRNGDILVAEWVPQGRVTLLQKIESSLNLLV